MIKPNENKIQKTDTIQDIFNRYSEHKFKLITALSTAGLKSVGPDSDLNKSLEDSFANLGKDSQKLEGLLNALNAIIPFEDKSPFTVTDRAAERIQKILEDQSKESWGLRFALKPGGCSGFEYDLDFQAEATSEQKIYEIGPVKLFVADRDLEKLRYSTVDYEDGLMQSGFQIQNPNATGSCGCGVSNSF